MDPTDPALAEIVLRASQAAAQTLGLNLHVLNAGTERDFDGVFAKVIELRAGGLVIGADSFFTARQEQLAAVALRHAVPTVYENREFVAAGGLASYGGAITDSYRLAGVYTARFSPSMTAKAAWNSSTFVPGCTGSSPGFSGLLNIDRDSTMPKLSNDSTKKSHGAGAGQRCAIARRPSATS